MARESMIRLIDRVRELIGDPAGAEQTFADDQIERALDVHRWEVRYKRLTPLPTYQDGRVLYLEWLAESGDWEEDAQVFDSRFQALTPAAVDPLNGRWTFTESQGDVFLNGKMYDPYGAAADLLETWAAKTAVEFDFEADGASYKRSQKSQALRALAKEYRLLQQVKTIAQVRSDVN